MNFVFDYDSRPTAKNTWLIYLCSIYSIFYDDFNVTGNKSHGTLLIMCVPSKSVVFTAIRHIKYTENSINSKSYHSWKIFTEPFTECYDKRSTNVLGNLSVRHRHSNWTLHQMLLSVIMFQLFVRHRYARRIVELLARRKCPLWHWWVCAIDMQLFSS